MLTRLLPLALLCATPAAADDRATCRGPGADRAPRDEDTYGHVLAAPGRPEEAARAFEQAGIRR